MNTGLQWVKITNIAAKTIVLKSNQQKTKKNNKKKTSSD